MIISITGGSAKLKDLAESITRHSAELLLDKKLIEKLTVDIEFSRTLLKEDGMLAEIDFDDRANKPGTKLVKLPVMVVVDPAK
jgi:hypothetical protein